MNSVSRTSRIWAVIYLVHAMIAVAVVAKYVGPGQWLGDLQLRTFGVYFPALSAVALFVPLVVLGRLMGAGAMGGGDLIALASGEGEDRGTKTLYLPMRGEESDGAVALLVSGPEHTLDQAFMREGDSIHVAVQGFVDDSLPGEIRSWFPERGGATLAESVRVLRPKVTQRRARSWFFGLAAAVLLGAGWFFWRDRVE